MPNVILKKNKSVGKILVAGASGMTGSAIVRLLVDEMPTTEIRGTWYSTRPDFIHRNIEYINADLTQREECYKVASGCDAAILSAGVTGGVLSSSVEPQRQVIDNIVMDTFLLEALAVAGVKRIIYLSSGTVYQMKKGKLCEDELDWNKDPPSPHFGVGWAKRMAEKLCEFWAEKAKIDIAVLRCSNIYGPGAVFDPVRSNFIPALIRKAVARENPFKVFGNPKVKRDVLFVSDAARAVVKLLKAKRPIRGVYNLCYGEAVTVGNVVKWILDASSHKDADVCYVGMSTGVPAREFDGRALQKTIGWMPLVTPSEGIKKTVLWWIENKGRWDK